MRGINLTIGLFLSLAVLRAAEVAVQVVDSQQKGIAGATVALIGLDGGRRVATADSAGAAMFADVGAGSYFVEAEAEGFAKTASARAVDLSAGGMIELELSVAGVHSTVVVTASGTLQSTDEVAKAMSVVDAGEIDLRAYKQVGDAIGDVPGMRVSQLGGPLATTYFKTRGLRNQDTAVLVDGLRLRDPAGPQGDASGVLQDLVITDPDRIEVLRGAGSSLYGTDATGGVVNIVTDAGGGRPRGSVGLDGGTLGSVHGAAKAAGGLRNDLIAYSLGVEHWNVMSGIDGDSPARNTSGQGQIALRLSKMIRLTGRIYAGDSFGFQRSSPFPVGPSAKGVVLAVPVPLATEHQYEAGVPLPSSLGSANFMPSAFDPDNTRAGRFFTGALMLAVRPSDKFGFTAQYQNVYTRRKYGDGPAGQGFQPMGTNLSKYVGKIDTANARVDFTLGRFQRVDAGWEFENEHFESLLSPPAPQVAADASVSQKSNSWFAQDQVRLFDGRLMFAAAYRGQAFSLDAPSFVPAAGAPVGTLSKFTAPPRAETGDLSAAYTFRTTGTKLRAHAGRGYRAPSLYERFGVYFSGTGYSLYGDPRLRPDRTNSIDGGVDQKLWNSRVHLSATYFFTKLNEVVIFDFSGAISPLTDPLGRFGGYRNTRGGLSRGVEFSARAAATRKLELSGAYTYTDAREKLPLVPGVWQSYNAPRHQFSVFATERISARWTALVGHIGSDSYLGPVFGAPYRFHGPERTQVELSYRRPFGENHALRLYVKANNLFNQTYYESGFLTPGATVTAGAVAEF